MSKRYDEERPPNLQDALEAFYMAERTKDHERKQLERQAEAENKNKPVEDYDALSRPEFARKVNEEFGTKIRYVDAKEKSDA